MKKAIFIFAFMMLLAMSLCFGYTITRVNPSPDEYSISTSASVVFNMTCMNDADSSIHMNGSIYWKTNRSGTYNDYSAIGNMTNNTAQATTITFDDGDRVWWFGSCYDLQGEFPVYNESYTLPAVNLQMDLANDTYGVAHVYGLVNDTGGDWREMNVDKDYNVTDGRIYFMNASLVGNTTLWTYQWPWDIINQTNTTVRIFDVDVAYYTLSLGANRMINFTLDTGDVAFAGDLIVSGGITMDDLIADDLIVDDIISDNISAGNVTAENIFASLFGPWNGSVNYYTIDQIDTNFSGYYPKTEIWNGTHDLNISTAYVMTIDVISSVNANGSLGINGNYTNNDCWTAYSLGIAYATNCTVA
jgi:hypothetical protein